MLHPRPAARALVLLAGVLLALLLPGCSTYDTLVEKDQVCEQRWADIEAQLQRRYDLIPNLVNVVKGAAKHEETVLAQVTQARSQAAAIKLTSEDLTDPEKMAAFQKAQDQLQGTLSRLLVVQESYPDLKANASFRDLQVQIEGTENRLLRAREQYNLAVREYNTELGKVGGAAVNKVTGKPFKQRVFFQGAAAAQAAPAVSF